MLHFNFSFIRFILLLGLVAVLIACTPEEEPEPEVLSSFIAFTIDGQDYRLNASNVTSLEGISAAEYTINPGSYFLNMAYSSITNADLTDVNLWFTQTDSLEVGLYPNAPGGEVFNFIAGLTDSTAYRLDPINGIGTMEITVFENQSGGKVEGKFSMPSLELLDEKRLFVSDGHVLTDGSFRIFLK